MRARRVPMHVRNGGYCFVKVTVKEALRLRVLADGHHRCEAGHQTGQNP